MCLSRLGQIIYGTLALATIGLIVAAMFTPGWRSLNNKLAAGNDSGDLLSKVTTINTINLGIFFCQIPNNTIANPSPELSSSDNAGLQGKQGLQDIASRTANTCIQWFNARPTWEKVVIASMILALLTALLAFIWNLLSFCACFCKGGILRPLPGLAGLTALLLGVALAIFYYNNKSYIKEMQNAIKVNTDADNLFPNVKNATQEIYAFVKNLDDTNNTVSYSFYLACGAALVAFANVIVGTLIVCLADKCL